MKFCRAITTSIAVFALLALVAVACGGGSDAEPAASAEAPAAAAQTDPTNDADGEESTVDSTDSDAAETGGVDSADSDAAETGGVDSADSDGATSNAWEVSVLHVNDDVQIVPAFDGPDGTSITLYDQNAIDGIELEYPLLATTHFGNRLALLVEEFDETGTWAKVQVPVRPNGSTAWVQTSLFTEERHDYHITIDLSENTVRLFKGDDPEPLVEQLSAVGRESRPTPVVRAYIDEKIPGADLDPAFGDWVLSLSAFSESLGTFGAGGLPKLAIQGTDEPALMGEYVTSGNVRLPNDIVSFIAETVPVGTVVEIVA